MTDTYITAQPDGRIGYLLVTTFADDTVRAVFPLTVADGIRAQQHGTPFEPWHGLPYGTRVHIRNHVRPLTCCSSRGGGPDSSHPDTTCDHWQPTQ